MTSYEKFTKKEQDRAKKAIEIELEGYNIYRVTSHTRSDIKLVLLTLEKVE